MSVLVLVIDNIPRPPAIALAIAPEKRLLLSPLLRRQSLLPAGGSSTPAGDDTNAKLGTCSLETQARSVTAL